MGICDHPDCEEDAKRRLFIGESVNEYCYEHYEKASALIQTRQPQWEEAHEM
jgi:hypothetical protein